MSRHLVYFVHANTTVRQRYASAFAPLGADVVFVHIRGLSSVYTKLAAELRGPDGRVLPGLRERYRAPRPAAEYATTTLITYSAGYALARALLASPEDRAELDVYVAIDSIHADLDEATSAEQLHGFAEFARMAREGGKVFWLGHSDVRTSGYASTTQVANRLLELAEGQGGGFLVRAFNVHSNDFAEHRAAVTEWGPRFATEALAHRLAT
jgi:hypothetical protein